MAITYPLNPPSNPGFRQVTLRRNVVGDVTESPYNLAQYAQTFPGQRWEADITLPKMKKQKIGAWRAFFAKLNGVEGTFLLGDQEFTAPLGSAAITPGAPVVDGAGQTGNSLAVTGLPVSTTGYLLEGDFIQLGSGIQSRLHMVLEDVDSNGSGDANITLWPSLRTSPADGGELILNNCKGVFRLSSPITDDTATPGSFYNASFSAIEAL